MTCDVCRRANLPGGLRCAYCGAYLPPSFDLTSVGDSETVSPSGAEASADTGASGGGMARAAGFLGGLVLLLMKAKSLIALLQFGKIALTLGSMFAYIGVYSQIYKWKFAVGFAISILIHELGHVYVNWRKGIPASAPMFIPFVGALIFVKKFPDNPTAQSESGAGGPVAGALAAFVCLGIYYLTGEQYWLALAAIGFLINLFNLLPFHPMQLDGSHVSQVFSPGVWNAIIVGMLLWALKVPSLALWVFILVAIAMRLTMGNGGRYLLATPMVRARMGAIYLLLCVALGYGTDHTASAIPSQRANAPAAVTETTGTDGTRRDATSESVRPAPAPTPLPAPRDETFTALDLTGEERTALSVIIAGASSVLLSILWVILPLWMASIGKWRPGAADTRLILSMVGLSLAAVIGRYFLPGTGWLSGSSLLTGAFAAAGIALCHVIYQAVRLRRAYTLPAPAILRTRLLAWAWAGALLVAYYTGGALLGISLIVLLTGFYARHPWMVPALQARLAESLGDREKALTYLENAIARCPESDVRAEMYHHTALLNLHLDRGADTLAALDAARREEESAAVPPPVLPPTAPRGIREMPDFDTRISALALTGRYDEALAHCERMLAATGGDPRTTALALFWVHLRLARMALLRGWHDEAVAQIEWCLKNVSTGAATMNASLRLLLAEAQAAQGRSESERAEANIVTALKASRESTIRAQAGTVRAQIALSADDRETASKEAEQAVRILPGHLACLYWWGRTGNPAMLESLAERFPNDYWGRRAKEALAAEPTSV